MDPVTHGIAGALIGKAYFGERHGRVAVFVVTLGAVFPDIDVICDVFSRDPIALLKFHRGFTHSFLGLPLFAIVLAWLTRWWEQRRGRDGASLPALALAYGAGIASHIVLDGMTSFGTRIWNPLSRDRAAWDLLFIIDFSFTAIILLPQVAAWIYGRREKSSRRALAMWILFSIAAWAVWQIAEVAEAPFGAWVVAVASALSAALVFVPAWRGRGFHVSRSSWARGGVYAMLGYLVICGVAHHVAIERVRVFAASNHLSVENLGALPLPPSLLDWSGIIRVRDGVYQSQFDLLETQPPAFRFIADSKNNPYTEEAMELPDVRTYLWFARFPLVRDSQRDGRNIFEFSDLRFFGRRSNGPIPFTFRVVLDSRGTFLEEGWVVAPRLAHPQRAARPSDPMGSQ
jgi:membrane-bound metal-dependent hydrolase YbcI (DUF457 family)